uniref:Uncharacterized protein n=1 Tax=Tetranychus urticae TaxID=32264 RepID=T1JU54_TETUR
MESSRYTVILVDPVNYDYSDHPVNYVTTPLPIEDCNQASSSSSGQFAWDSPINYHQPSCWSNYDSDQIDQRPVIHHLNSFSNNNDVSTDLVNRPSDQQIANE